MQKLRDNCATLPPSTPERAELEKSIEELASEMATGRQEFEAHVEQNHREIVQKLARLAEHNKTLLAALPTRLAFWSKRRALLRALRPDAH